MQISLAPVDRADSLQGSTSSSRSRTVLLITLAEGEITELHVGVKGAMSALYLKDLTGPDGATTTGEREIDENEAGVVRRIFAAFASGMSPRRSRRT